MSMTGIQRSPTVSVFLPSYNHARYLAESLDSILHQTYQDLEIVLADDGSTDGSPEIAEAYRSRHPDKLRVLYHPNHENRGISATCNLAIAKSRGRYFAGASSDDIWYPNWLEMQMPMLENDPRIGMVYARSDAIDGNGELLGWTAGDRLPDDALGLLLQKNSVCGPTQLFRRECVDRLGAYDETLVYSDWELWIRFASHYRFCFLDRPLARYRVHDSNTSVGIPRSLTIERNLEVLSALRSKRASVGGLLCSPPYLTLLDLQTLCTYFELEATGRVVSTLDSDLQTKLRSLDCDSGYYSRWLRTRMSWSPGFGRLFVEKLTPYLTVASARRLTREVVAYESWSDAKRCFAAGDLGRARMSVLRSISQCVRPQSVRALLAMLGSLLPGHRLRRRLLRVATSHVGKQARAPDRTPRD
jgi:hypothetical protein